MTRNKYKVWDDVLGSWVVLFANALPTSNGANSITLAKTHITDNGDYSGYATYYDSATVTTPISIVKDVWTALPNDCLGNYTSEDAMSTLCSKLFDSTTGAFFFEDLPTKTSVELKASISVLTTVANTHIQFRLSFDAGIFETTDQKGKLNVNQSVAISEEDISQNFEFYLHSETIRDSIVKVEVLASENVDIKVSNFYVKVLK